MGNTNAKPHPKPRNKKQVRWRAAERPSPPGKPSLIQENGSIPDLIHICWQKPEKDGGSPIILYLVEHRRVGSTHWIKSNTHPVTTTELAVNGLEPGWRYQFRIRAENAVGLSDCSEVSEPFTVILHRSVITAPKFTQELKEATVLEESKVEFEVHFLGQPIPNICWFKDGFEIFSSNRIRIMTVSDKSVLTILHATIADEGEIKCTGTNKAGHASTKGKLTVEAPPTIQLPKSYQEQDGIIFEIGEAIALNVFVGGRPTPLVFWSHNGESIQNDDRHELEYLDKTATLKIENAIRSDRGEYQIKAVNKLSQDQASFLVTITDKPTPPGKARVLSASGRSVTLSWSTPEDDGGCKIGSYIVEYYRIGWNVWLKAATCRQMTTMLGNLIEGSQYIFRVKAESPYGVSDPSEVSDPLFIPDAKRGINHPSDIKREENQTFLSLEPSRKRRASSSPRVSFSLNEDMPVRPERKKTGKTPEASPRLKRKQLSPITNREEDIQMKANALISSTNSPLAIPPAKQEKSSPTVPRKDSSNRNNSDEVPSFPTERRKSLNVSESSYNSIQGNSFEKEKTKSPSPEILITLADNENKQKFEKSKSFSLDRSPIQRRRSFGETNNFENSDSLNSTIKTFKSPSIESLSTEGTKNRIRPPLNRQEFSGSSEFMLVLCPEGEQGAQLRELGIDFEGESIPPPISLSAPELGMEPPHEPLLRRSSSSSELLNFHLMERLRYAVFAENENSVVRKNDNINKRNLDIPTIQLNSKPTDKLSGLERKPSHNRRLSVEIVSKSPQNWSQRRYSLKNSNDISTRKLERFQETEENKRELLEYRQTEMKLEKEENYSTNSGMNEFVDEFSMEYEESISSEEETDSSSNEPLNSNISPTAKYEDEDVEETYNPRNRTVMSTTVSNNDPFEILTVRKDPPSTSIVPKPILKKKSDNNVFNAREIPTFSGLNTKRDRSHSLTDASSPSIPSEKNDQRKLREQSNSPNYVDTIEEHTIEKLPNGNTRRSFSLIPNQATSLKETFISRKKKNPSSADRKLNESRSVSALANCTSITGTGVIMKENMISNKEIEEEAKVVVDFYGDIVKSFGGKQKPIAEISNYGPKYDTFEEKKICKPDFKEFGQNKTEIKSPITLHEPVPKENESRLETGISSAVSSYNYERNSDSIYKMNGMANSRGSNIRQVEHEQFEYQRKSVSPSRKRHSPLVDDTSPQRKLFRDTRRNEKSKSRSNSSIAKRPPRSRDASTSPVRFEYWEHDVSSRHSLERDYFRTSSVTSSRSSSLTRQTHSPVRPILRAITTQTSFRVEPPTPADILKKQVELATKAEKRMKGVFEYFTDLAMMSVACWFYLFQSEYLAIPILVILVYRQLSEKMKKFGESMKKYIPRWIMKKFTRNYDQVQP